MGKHKCKSPKVIVVDCKEKKEDKCKKDNCKDNCCASRNIDTTLIGYNLLYSGNEELQKQGLARYADDAVLVYYGDSSLILFAGRYEGKVAPPDSLTGIPAFFYLAPLYSNQVEPPLVPRDIMWTCGYEKVIYTLDVTSFPNCPEGDTPVPGPIVSSGSLVVAVTFNKEGKIVKTEIFTNNAFGALAYRNCNAIGSVEPIEP